MLKIAYTPAFIRQVKALSDVLFDEVEEKIELLKDEKNHKALKVHKLKGRLKGRYSFSVNYQIRIVFKYNPRDKQEAILLAIGDHDVYAR